MYLDFYGLFEEPFATSPDARFAYLSSGYRAAIEKTLDAVERSRGLAVILGEVGTGKSTLSELLYKRLRNNANYMVAIVADPSTTPGWFIRNILKEYGQEGKGRTLDELKNDFKDFIFHQTQELGKTMVVLVDEAQTMESRTLETLRLILNFERGSQKLLQVIVLGQDELKDKLRRKENIANRITAVSQLQPLDPKETGKLIEWRLHIAGRDAPLFTPAAVQAIYDGTMGVPRRICIVANEALNLGYKSEVAMIDADLIPDAVAGVTLR